MTPQMRTEKHIKKIFDSALERLEPPSSSNEFSCNVLKSCAAQLLDPLELDRNGTINTVDMIRDRYRTMFGFKANADVIYVDKFLAAVEKDSDSYGLRLLLLSLAKVAWNDFKEEEDESKENDNN